MNKLKYIVTVGLMLGFMSSCVDLDYTEENSRDEAWLYENPFQGAQAMVWDVYAQMYNEFEVNRSGAFKASTTDEAEFASSMGDIQNYYDGGWSPNNPFPSTYESAFRAIAEANIYMEKIEKLEQSLEVFKYGATYADDRRQFELHPYELRFLRAYYHFELAKTYGDAPIVTISLTNEQANRMQRQPAQDVFKFVVDECDAIINYLPGNYMTEPGQGVGRATKAAVLALKSRTLLYAASPLHNKEGNKELWRKAAQAAKELIDKAPQWGLKLSAYEALWGKDAFIANSELIMGVGRGASNDFEKQHYPVGIENGRSGNCPTQSLVDMYEYQANGKTFKEVNPDVINLNENPYEGLDPRFALSIIKNGDLWPLNGAQQSNIETFYGGFNALPKYEATPTGYYLRKYVDGNNVTTYNNQTSSRHTWIIWRLAEAYLNYAEAMYNLYGDADAKGEFGMSANEAVNVLRSRPDINMPLFEGNNNFMEKYMRERAVEFAFEDHRFWDVRRWKKGAEFFSKIEVADIRKNGEELVLTRIIKNRIWDEKYNLFPIPQSELDKNPNIEQNPGWDSDLLND